jgi:hypothetical protein
MATNENPMDVIEQQARERITKQLQAKGRQNAEKLADASEDDRTEMAMLMVLSVCDPGNWVESPADDAPAAEVDKAFEKFVELQAAMARIVLDASKTRPAGINSEAEMVTAIREALDLSGAENVLADSWGVSHSDTFEDAGVLTSNKGLVVTLGNGAQFQIKVIQSRPARRRE